MRTNHVVLATAAVLFAALSGCATVQDSKAKGTQFHTKVFPLEAGNIVVRNLAFYKDVGGVKAVGEVWNETPDDLDSVVFTFGFRNEYGMGYGPTTITLRNLRQGEVQHFGDVKMSWNSRLDRTRAPGQSVLGPAAFDLRLSSSTTVAAADAERERLANEKEAADAQRRREQEQNAHRMAEEIKKQEVAAEAEKKRRAAQRQAAQREAEKKRRAAELQEEQRKAAAGGAVAPNVASTPPTVGSGRIQVGMTEEQVIPLCDNSYQRRAGSYGMTAVCKIGFGAGYFIMYDQGPGPGRRVVGVDLCALARNRGMCD